MQSAMNEVTSRPKVYHLRESSGARTRRVELNSRCYVRVFTLNNYSSRHLPPAGRYTQLPILMTLICHAMPRQIGLFQPTTLYEPYLYEKTRSFATTIPPPLTQAVVNKWRRMKLFTVLFQVQDNVLPERDRRKASERAPWRHIADTAALHHRARHIHAMPAQNSRYQMAGESVEHRSTTPLWHQWH